MKNMVIAFLATALGYGVAAAQPAVQMQMMNAEKTKAEKPAKIHICKGHVEAVDAVARTITVKTTEGKDEGMTMVMPVGVDAKITRRGRVILLSDVMVGEMAVIRYTGEMPAPVVKTVRVEMTHMLKEKMEEKAEKKEEQKEEMKEEKKEEIDK